MRGGRGRRRPDRRHLPGARLSADFAAHGRRGGRRPRRRKRADRRPRAAWSIPPPRWAASPARHRFSARRPAGDRPARAVRRRNPFRHLDRRPHVVGLGTAVRQALALGLAEIGRPSAHLGARLRDGGRAQPVRYAEHPYAGSAFTALLQHRRRGRPGNRGHRGARPLAKYHARVSRLVSPTTIDSTQLTIDSTIDAQIAVHQKSSM